MGVLMYGAIAVEAYEESLPGGGTPGLGSYGSMSSSKSSVPQCNYLEGTTDMSANGTYERRNVAGRRNNNCADAKIARRKFIAAEVARLPVADVMEITGMTETAVHNVRRAKNAVSHENLCLLLEARPDFRARFFCSVGGELLVRPDQVVALERAINSVMRGES